MMDIMEIVEEIYRAEKLIEKYAQCYYLHEIDCPTDFKMIMFLNEWHNPFVALNELLKVIDRNEMFIKRKKKRGVIINYKSRYKEMYLLLQKEVNKHGEHPSIIN